MAHTSSGASSALCDGSKKGTEVARGGFMSDMGRRLEVGGLTSIFMASSNVWMRKACRSPSRRWMMAADSSLPMVARARRPSPSSAFHFSHEHAYACRTSSSKFIPYKKGQTHFTMPSFRIALLTGYVTLRLRPCARFAHVTADIT